MNYTVEGQNEDHRRVQPLENASFSLSLEITEITKHRERI